MFQITCSSYSFQLKLHFNLYRDKLMHIQYTHTNAYITHTYVHTHIHTYIHTYIRTYIYTYIHTYVLTCVRTYVRTCVHTYIYVRTYIHIYIHTYLSTYISFQILPLCDKNLLAFGRLWAHFLSRAWIL